MSRMIWAEWHEQNEMSRMRWAEWDEQNEMSRMRWAEWDEENEMSRMRWAEWDEQNEMSRMRWAEWDGKFIVLVSVYFSQKQLLRIMKSRLVIIQCAGFKFWQLLLRRLQLKYDPIKYGKTIDRASIIKLCPPSWSCHIWLGCSLDVGAVIDNWMFFWTNYVFTNDPWLGGYLRQN